MPGKNIIKLNLKNSYIYSPVTGVIVDACDNYILLENEFGSQIKIELFAKNNSIQRYVKNNQRISRYSKLFKINKFKRNLDWMILTIIDDNADIVITKQKNLKAKDYLLAII